MHPIILYIKDFVTVGKANSIMPWLAKSEEITKNLKVHYNMFNITN